MNFYTIIKINWRYFISKKNINLINILSGISILSISIIISAMIILLSAFNGLSGLIYETVNNIESSIHISQKNSKLLYLNDTLLNIDKYIDAKFKKYYVLQEDVLVKYKQKQIVLSLKGIEREYLNKDLIQNAIIYNKTEFDSIKKEDHFLLVGIDVAYKLDINMADKINKVEIYAPKYNTKQSLLPNDIFNFNQRLVNAVFSLNTDYDAKVIFMDYYSVKNILNVDSLYINKLEINLEDKSLIFEVQEKLKKSLPSTYEIKNIYELNDYFYKIINTEKYAVFLILLLIGFVAAINSIGSIILTMMEKKDELNTIYKLGGSKNFIFNLVFFYGINLFLISIFIGGIIGSIFVFIQKKYQIIVLNAGSKFARAYPMDMTFFDLIIILSSVLLLGSLISYISAKRINYDFVKY